MALTAQEQQLLDLLQQKQSGAQQTAAQTAPPLPGLPLGLAPGAPALDLVALSQLIDDRIANAFQMVEKVQAEQARTARPPEESALPVPPQPQIQITDKQLIDRLRPIVMKALSFEQKGRLAELAMTVRINAQSHDHALTVGQSAFLDFLATHAGREWIQLGASAFLAAITQVGEAQVPTGISVKQQ
jgi:hypothetical protein